MDDVVKHESARLTRLWLNAFTAAMEVESVPDETRRRILNRVLFGNPDGFAEVSMAVELHLTTRQPIPHIESHDYLSTACFHGEHGYCAAPTVNRDGSWNHLAPSYSSERDAPKNPAQCKFCKAPCRCQCHQGTPQ